MRSSNHELNGFKLG